MLTLLFLVVLRIMVRFIPNNGYYLSDQNALEVNGDGFDCAISQVTESEETTWAWFAASQNGGFSKRYCCSWFF